MMNRIQITFITTFQILLCISGSAQNSNDPIQVTAPNVARIGPAQPMVPSTGAGAIGLIDSTYSWPWNTADDTWHTTARSKTIGYGYNANYDITEATILIDEGSGWENNTQYTNTYDADNNWVGQNYRSWEMGAWQDTYQWINQFDAQGNMETSVVQSWSGTTWENLGRTINTYNINNQPINYLNQNWNGSDWENNSMQVFSYNANELLVTKLSQLWIDGNWQESMQTYYSYDADNNIDHELVQTIQLSSTWENHIQRNNSYDGADNLTRTIFEIWNGTGWDSSSDYWIGYDPDGIIHYRKYFHTNETGSVINTGDSTHFYYHTVFTGVAHKPEIDHIQIHPNPSTGHFILEAQTPSGSLYSVLDGIGRTVQMGTLYDNRTEIDLRTQPDGIYILKIQTDNDLQVERLIKQ